MICVRVLLALVVAVLFTSSEQSHGQGRAKGTAVVVVDDKEEYTITIECEDAARPEAGFSTEPSRVVREATGRNNFARLTVRPWRDTGELVVTLDRYAAWIPAPTSADGRFSMVLDMSPSSSIRDGIPVTMTYEQWASGDRPAGLENVRIAADCTRRDPEAPAYRVIDKSGEN